MGIINLELCCILKHLPTGRGTPCLVVSWYFRGRRVVVVRCLWIKSKVEWTPVCRYKKFRETGYTVSPQQQRGDNWIFSFPIHCIFLTKDSCRESSPLGGSVVRKAVWFDCLQSYRVCVGAENYIITDRWLKRDREATAWARRSEVIIRLRAIVSMNPDSRPSILDKDNSNCEST